MPLSIEEQIQGLADTISSAQWHFDVWEALEEARSDSKTVSVLNKYREFFRATTTANFESTIIACYQLLETGDDRICFPSLKRDLLATELINVDSSHAIVELQQKMKTIWIGISQIRNKSVGHLSKHDTQTQIYTQAGLNPALIRKFISHSIDLHRRITYRRNRSRDAFNIRGKSAVEKLLADLRGQS